MRPNFLIILIYCAVFYSCNNTTQNHKDLVLRDAKTNDIKLLFNLNELKKHFNESNYNIKENIYTFHFYSKVVKTNGKLPLISYIQK